MRLSTRITLSIPDKVQTEIREFCKDNNVSMSYLLRHGFYLAKKKILTERCKDES